MKYVIAFMVCLALVSCGSEVEEVSTTTDTQNVSTEATTEANETEEMTTEDVVSEENPVADMVAEPMVDDVTPTQTEADDMTSPES